MRVVDAANQPCDSSGSSCLLVVYYLNLKIIFRWAPILHAGGGKRERKLD